MTSGAIDDKLYIFLGLNKTHAGFFKPTSRTRYYDIRPELLSGCVVYAGGQIPELPKPKTIIDATGDLWKRPKDQLAGLLSREPRRIRGVMPAEFHERLRRAIQQAKGLGDDDRAERLGFIGISTAP